MGQQWLPEPPPMDDRDLIEAHELERRRTLAAFLWGAQARRGSARQRHAEATQGLLLGAVLALIIALVIGVAALINVSRQKSQHSSAVPAQVATPVSAQADASTAAS